MTGNRRVAVTSPQTRLAHSRRRHRGRWRVSTLDPAEAEHAVVLYRIQRRRAAIAVGLLALLVFGLSLALTAFPGLADVRLADIPVSWLALGVLPFPAMVLLAVWQLRRAEAPEHSDLEDGDTRGAAR
ncbi:hypothetical protein SAMN05216266_12647 [Amycolatopsis marina]|uniref:Uncharacterized protein n=1 Tax=Amycolatopsis marina TaxID=490629 RepID=A0A1I1CDN3_9PSEU|nr:hypothetical protein [Amycolatopsis marina]SFB60815.1 hypothetical protein SAMN05216266_12647 [Amycolatopsis marina]